MSQLTLPGLAADLPAATPLDGRRLWVELEWLEDLRAAREARGEWLRPLCLNDPPTPKETR